MMIVPAGSFGGVVDERAAELRWQLFLRADLGPHVRWQCGHIARVDAASNRSGNSVVRARSGNHGLVVFVARRKVSVTPLSPIAIGAGGPRLVGLRFRWQRTVWQIVEHVIVRIVIDDRRKRWIILRRIIIIALWRINLRWRVGLS